MRNNVGAYEDRIIQCVLVSKDIVPRFETAKAWVQSLRLSVAVTGENDKFWRFQQQHPSLFVKGTFRTRKHSPGIQMIVALHKPGIFDGMKARKLK